MELTAKELAHLIAATRFALLTQYFGEKEAGIAQELITRMELRMRYKEANNEIS